MSSDQLYFFNILIVEMLPFCLSQKINTIVSLRFKFTLSFIISSFIKVVFSFSYFHNFFPEFLGPETAKQRCS